MRMVSMLWIAPALLAAIVLLAPAPVHAVASVVVDAGFSGYTYWEHSDWPVGGLYYHYRNADAAWGKSHPVVSEKRGFISFNTDEILHGTVRKVELYYAHSICYSSGPGVPVNWAMQIYIGRFLYGWIDGGDWNAGTYTITHNWDGAPRDEWIDLGPTAVSWFQQYGTGGWTDIKLKDASPSWPGDWTAIANSCLNPTKAVIPNICRLKITYDPTPVVDASAKKVARSTWGAIKAAYR